MYETIFHHFNIQEEEVKENWRNKKSRGNKQQQQQQQQEKEKEKDYWVPFKEIDYLAKITSDAAPGSLCLGTGANNDLICVAPRSDDIIERSGSMCSHFE